MRGGMRPGGRPGLQNQWQAAQNWLRWVRLPCHPDTLRLRPIENDAPAAYVRGSLKGCIRNCSVSNPFRIARSADVCAQTGLRCGFKIRRAGSSARHFCGQGRFANQHCVGTDRLTAVSPTVWHPGRQACRVWRRSVRERITLLKRYKAATLAWGCGAAGAMQRAETFCVGTLALPRPKDGDAGSCYGKRWAYGF